MAEPEQKKKHRLPQLEAVKKSVRRGVGRRKRLPHIDAQGFTIQWRRRFRLRTDFFTASTLSTATPVFKKAALAPAEYCADRRC